jgi:hypothetical protein
MPLPAKIMQITQLNKYNQPIISKISFQNIVFLLLNEPLYKIFDQKLQLDEAFVRVMHACIF